MHFCCLPLASESTGMFPSHFQDLSNHFRQNLALLNRKAKKNEETTNPADTVRSLIPLSQSFFAFLLSGQRYLPSPPHRKRQETVPSPEGAARGMWQP